MSEQRPGFYQDEFGNWLKDRRRNVDRRGGSQIFPHHDRRLQKRRKTDRDIIERDAKLQIEEALEEFAAHHDEHGHRIDD
ncbi:MAG: hypothetical protein AMXMBFR4_33480 [Candidatus Hydrogenedentota bacterium]